MSTETPKQDTYQVRYDDILIAAYDPAEHPTPEAVIADMATWVETAMEIHSGVYRRFEVWRGGLMVATARRDGDTKAYIPGPPFDRTRSMPAGIVAAFDKCFPGVLDRTMLDSGDDDDE